MEALILVATLRRTTDDRVAAQSLSMRIAAALLSLKGHMKIGR
jgi:hypothetical protein